MTPRQFAYALAAVLGLLTLGYWQGCSRERARTIQQAQTDRQRQDSLLRVREDSLAVIVAQNALLAQQAARSKAQADSQVTAFRAAQGRLARLRAHSDSLAQTLAEATTTADSLSRAMDLVHGLTQERDSLTGAVNQAVATIRQQAVAYAELQQLQRGDSARADLEGRRADALRSQRDALSRELAATKRGFALKLKLGSGVVLAGGVALCALTTVC